MKPDHPFVHRIQVKDRDGRVIGEKEVVSYRGLLDMVHKERVREIRTTLIQAPSKDNGETAIVLAMVRTNRGRFTGLGDANPRNVTAKIVPHLIRMAETRAEARAMRKAVNIGVVAMEELGDDLADDLTYEGTIVPANREQRSTPSSVPSNGRDNGSPNTRPPAPLAPPTSVPPSASRGSDSRASDQQRRFVYRLLSERGITGDAARDLIKRELGVATLDEAGKFAVSAFIDRFKNANGNGHSNGHGQSEPGEHG